MLYTLGPCLWSRTSALRGGKMRIGENARRMVVFFGSPAAPSGTIEFGGTAFLVAHQEGGRWFNVLVTARHVAEQVRPENGIVLRLNKKDGTAISLDIDIEIGWRFHPDDSVDLAVTPINLTTDEFTADDLDIALYGLHDMVRRDVGDHRVRCGDPIAIVGLFRLHPGVDRNTPIVHSGNIALLPDAQEKIQIKDRVTGKPKMVEAYLVEAQTFEGLSGAPVFQAQMVELDNYPDLNGGRPMAITGVQLLGVYQGAWDGEASDLLVDDRRWKGNRRVPVGMGIVVPSERLWELIMTDPELKKQRANALQKAAEHDATATTDFRPFGIRPTRQRCEPQAPRGFHASCNRGSAKASTRRLNIAQCECRMLRR